MGGGVRESAPKLQQAASCARHRRKFSSSFIVAK
jgi:hypothetical protein